MTNIEEDPSQLLDSWLNELTNIGQIDKYECVVKEKEPEKATLPSTTTNSNVYNQHTLHLPTNVITPSSPNLSLKLKTPCAQLKSPKLPPKPPNLSFSKNHHNHFCNIKKEEDHCNMTVPGDRLHINNQSNADFDKDDDLEAILGELLELEKQLALETSFPTNTCLPNDYPAPPPPRINLSQNIPVTTIHLPSYVPYQAPPPNFLYSYTSIQPNGSKDDQSNSKQSPDYFPPPPAFDDPLLSCLVEEENGEVDELEVDDGRDSAFSDDIPSSHPPSKASNSSSSSSFFYPCSALSTRHTRNSEGESPANDTTIQALALTDQTRAHQPYDALESGQAEEDVNKHYNLLECAKEEKIRLALLKLKEANIKKMFVKAYSPDGSAKCVLVEEDKTCGQICALLSLKNHLIPDNISWALVEHLPELMMERVMEDHEKLVENISYWTRDSPNKILFLKTDEKYEMFSHSSLEVEGPSLSSYKLSQNDPSLETTLKEADGCSYTSHNTDSDTLQASAITKFKEYFITKILQNQRNSSISNIADLEGFLYVKLHRKKVWKKYWCILRSSGLYFAPKSGKTNASKDLICFCRFENVNVYYGFGWHKKYKAPTDFGFALKVPQVQVPLSKHTKYFCLEDSKALLSWVNGIRIAKYGTKLAENFYDAKRMDTHLFSNEVSSPAVSLTKSVSDTNLASNIIDTYSSIATCIPKNVEAHASLLNQGTLQKRISLSPSNCSVGYNTSYSSSSGKGSSATNSADLSLLGVIITDPAHGDLEIVNTQPADHKALQTTDGKAVDASLDSNLIKTTTNHAIILPKRHLTQPTLPSILIKKSYPKMPLIGMAASVVASFQNKVENEFRENKLEHVVTASSTLGAYHNCSTVGRSKKLPLKDEVPIMGEFLNTTSASSTRNHHFNSTSFNDDPFMVQVNNDPFSYEQALNLGCNYASLSKAKGHFGNSNLVSPNPSLAKRGLLLPPRRDPGTLLQSENIFLNSSDTPIPSSLRRSSLTTLIPLPLPTDAQLKPRPFHHHINQENLSLPPPPLMYPQHSLHERLPLNCLHTETYAMVSDVISFPNENPHTTQLQFSPRFTRLPSHQTSPALTMNKMVVEELKRKQERVSAQPSITKHTNTALPHNLEEIYGNVCDDVMLPPPPPELLDDLGSSNYEMCHRVNLNGNREEHNVKASNNPFGQTVKRRVPQPPKRSEATRLSTTCSMILPSFH